MDLFYCAEICKNTNLHVRKAKGVEKLMRDQTDGAENEKEVIFFIIQHTIKTIGQKQVGQILNS